MVVIAMGQRAMARGLDRGVPDYSKLLTTHDDFWQTVSCDTVSRKSTHPEKHAPKTLVEAAFPADGKGPTLQTLFEGNGPAFFPHLRSDAKMSKALDLILKARRRRSNPKTRRKFFAQLFTAFTRTQRFFIGKMEDQRGLTGYCRGRAG